MTASIELYPAGDGWPYGGTIDSVADMGAEVVEMPVDGVCVDEENK